MTAEIGVEIERHELGDHDKVPSASCPYCESARRRPGVTPGDLARVEQIRARADAATDGPWVVDRNTPFSYEVVGVRSPSLRAYVVKQDVNGYDDDDEESDPDALNEADAAFIAAVRADVPWLLDRLAAETERADKWYQRATEERRARLTEAERADVAEAAIEDIRKALGAQEWEIVMEAVESNRQRSEATG